MPLGLDKAALRIVTILAGIALICVLCFGLAFCHQRDVAKRAENAATQAQGRTVSAVDAIDKINDLSERSNATDAEVKEATDAIRQADPADRDRVFRYRTCLLQHRSDCDGLL